MKNILLILTLLLLLLLVSCQPEYSNPPFVVITLDECFENGMQTYYSKEGNMVLTYCNKYQIGDTIPNVCNYTFNK